MIELHERYRLEALSYCDAAARLNDLKPNTHYIAPIGFLLAHGIELFLKCVLLKAGKSSTALSKRPYGHDLWHMWNLPELSVQRQQAVIHANACHGDLQQLPLNIPVAGPNTFNEFLEMLSKLHTNESEMALRYPKQKTPVPLATLLVCVFERLIRKEKLGDTIVPFGNI